MFFAVRAIGRDIVTRFRVVVCLTHKPKGLLCDQPLLGLRSEDAGCIYVTSEKSRRRMAIEIEYLIRDVKPVWHGDMERATREASLLHARALIYFHVLFQRRRCTVG
jgi:hypothetical protein